jgi:hypothetical protein
VVLAFRGKNFSVCVYFGTSADTLGQALFSGKHVG